MSSVHSAMAHGRSLSSLRRIAALGVLSVGLLGFSTSADASVGAQVAQPVVLAPPMQVGDTDVAQSIRVTGGGGTGTPTSVMTIPSCGSVADSTGNCPVAERDPGVFRVSTAGVGRANTVCAGLTFTIVDIDPAQGKYEFRPSAPYTVVPSVGSDAGNCLIDYTVDVLRWPAKNAFPGRDAGAPDWTTVWGWSMVGAAENGQPVTQANSNAYYIVDIPEPADSDGDGVSDQNDFCPGTPTATSVDGNGCPLIVNSDTDGDGVSNFLDDCPGTPSGTAVDANGCPIVNNDTDGDGITNADDLCPGTPSGTSVDANGCPVVVNNDADGDGVTNTNDRCPGTPAGTSVDANGCTVVPPPADSTPTTVDHCKRDGWRAYGPMFKNQGDCVSFVATQSTVLPAGPA